MPYQSAGYGVASEIQDILARRRADSRQAMIDEISRKNNESIMADREANRRIQEEQAKAVAEWREAQAYDLEHKSLGNQFRMGQDVSDLDPAIIEKLQKHGYLSNTAPEGTTPHVDVSSSFTDPTTGQDTPFEGPQDESVGAPQPQVPEKKHMFFSGTADEQKALHRQIMIGQLMSDPNFSNMDGIHQFMALMSAGGNLEDGLKNISAGMFNKAEDKHSPSYIEYNDYVKSLPKGQKPISFDAYMTQDANRHKVAPPSVSISIIGTDSKGQPIFAANRLDKDGKPIVKGGETPDHQPLGPKPTAATVGSGRISTADANMMRDAIRKSGLNKTGIRGNTVNPEAQAGLNVAQNKIISYLPTPELKLAVADLLNNPKRDQYSVDQIMKMWDGQELPPDQLDLLREVVTYVLGRFN